MRAPAVLVAIALAVPGCELVFPLGGETDRVPHVPEGPLEEPNEVEFDQVDELFTLDTTLPTPIGNDFGAVFTLVRQDGGDNDVLVMQVGTLTIGSGKQFRVAGRFPLVIVARTIVIDGLLDASAGLDFRDSPGPGGGRPGMDDPGQGNPGTVSGSTERTSAGGGGGGFATEGGPGGAVECVLGRLDSAEGGSDHGDARLSALVGGGAGGNGGRRCVVRDNPGGYGGGAIQLSATESISIGDTGFIRASGGGGGGGAGDMGACELTDDAGGGGGGGGAIYLDAPQLSNTGAIEAHGGGGGGGGSSGTGPNDDNDGIDGHFGNETETTAPFGVAMPSLGGPGAMPKGTNGGDGAVAGLPTAGGLGDCSVIGMNQLNTGGGGGAVGRIVVRARGVSPFGTFSPLPTELAYPIP